jgi:hypothetical protein
MPRVYKRKLGTGPYENYSDATLVEALGEIRSKMSVRDAAEIYT